jgi:hypothetical protein
MGLRIIGRRPKSQIEISEADKTRELEHTMSDWLEARGGAQAQSAKAEFLEHFCRVKNRMATSAEPESMLQMAHKLKASITGGSCEGIASHSKVDVATLLELL